MRRAERELKNRADVLQIFAEAQFGHLALVDGNLPYCVPLNFALEEVGDELRIYFHCAPEGRKLDCLRRNPRGYFCVELDCRFSENAHAQTMHYRSAAAEGSLAEVVDPAEKARILALLMYRYTKTPPPPAGSAVFERMAILILCVESLSGKSNPGKAAP